MQGEEIRHPRVLAGEDIDRLQREDVRIEARIAPSAKAHIFPPPSEHMLVADDVLGRGGVMGVAEGR